MYIDEIENVADKEKFEKIKAEMKQQRKEEDCAVPEGFGKPQENADQFTNVTALIKKKRPRAEFEADQGIVKEDDKENNAKRAKLD